MAGSKHRTATQWWQDGWDALKAGAKSLQQNVIDSYKNTSESMKENKTPTEETVTEITQEGTLTGNNATTPTKMDDQGIKNLYPSLYAPQGVSSDNMSGWRSTMSALNNKYGGDIVGYAYTNAFNGLNSADKAQYYQDVGYFNNLYNTVNSYDTDIANEQRKAREAEAYANVRQQLMQKYMPTTLAAMGYANTGLAADALAGLNNRYENFTINAKNQAEQNQSDILNSYRKQANQYAADMSAQEAQDLQESQDKYDGYLDKIYSDPINFNTNTLQSALTKGTITQEQYDELMSIYDEAYAEAELKQTGDDQKEVYDNFVYDIYADVSNFNTSLLTAALKMGKITQEQYNELETLYNEELEKHKGTIQESEASGYYDQFKQTIVTSPETFNPEELSQAAKLGYITEAQKNELLMLYQQEFPAYWAVQGGTKEVTNSEGITDKNASVIMKEGGFGSIIPGAGAGLTPDQMMSNIDVILEGQSGKVSGKKGSLLKDAVAKAKAGKLWDGQVIDLNYGDGEYYVLYQDGKFYPVSVTKTNTDWGLLLDQARANK